MKVCLDIRVSTKGGTSTFIDNYVRALDEVQHDHNIHFVFNEDTTPLNGRHPRIAAVPYNNRMLEFQWSQLNLARIVKKHNFDVYHSLKHVGPILCSAKTIYRVPAVGQFLGNYPMRTLDHIYWKHVAGAAYRKADLLIAVSQYVANALTETLHIPADRVITINNGVDSRYRKLAPDEMDPDRWRRHGIADDFSIIDTIAGLPFLGGDYDGMMDLTASTNTGLVLADFDADVSNGLSGDADVLSAFGPAGILEFQAIIGTGSLCKHGSCSSTGIFKKLD